MKDNINNFHGEMLSRGIKAVKDVPMREHTSFKIGGGADVGAFPKSGEELKEAVTLATELGLSYYVVGNGSNLLVSDEGYRGVIIFTTEMDEVRFEGTSVYASAGASLTGLSRAAADKGLSGLEFAFGIPGSIGGAVYMNAGAYDGEMKDVTLSSRYWSPTEGFGTLEGEAQGFGYRESAYMGSDRMILDCHISLREGNRGEIMAYCRELMGRRRDKQPLEYPSAGSAFKRYPGRYTAQMIDAAGLKGYTVGGAQVSEKHAGFIVNRGGATAKDVAALVSHIKEVILQKEGVEIESEIRYLSAEGEGRL